MMAGQNGAVRAPAALKPDVFQDITIWIVSNTFAETEFEALYRLCTAGGAQHLISESATDRTVPRDTQYIIAKSIDFSAFDKAVEALIPVVTPKWISDSAERGILQPIRCYSPDPRMIFNGINICCMALPENMSLAIIQGVMAVGGRWSDKMSRAVTHLITADEESDDVEKILAKGFSCKIVRHEWFSDSFRSGRCLPENSYAPRGLTHRIAEVDLGDSDDPDGSTTDADRMPEFSASSELGLRLAHTLETTVFKSRRIKLSDDLALSKYLRLAIEDLIIKGGAELVENVRQADILICRHRESAGFSWAFHNGIEIGNLPWLFHVLARDEFSSPTRQLLHYPFPKAGIPGFPGAKIAVSNYAGHVRLYLETLTFAARGAFTRSMRQDNTHLVTSSLQSEKADAAKEWGIAIVNHLWLEESYAKGKLQNVKLPRYSQFPPPFNLAEVIAQTPIDLSVIEESLVPSPGEADDNGVGADVQMLDNQLNATRDPSIASDAPSTSTDTSHSTSNKTSTRTRTHNRDKTPPSAQTPSSYRALAALDGNTRAPSRKAKIQAQTYMHDVLAPDIALYEKEKKRVAPGAPWGGVRAANALDRSRKRSLSDASSTSASSSSTTTSATSDHDAMTIDGADGPPSAQRPKSKPKSQSSSKKPRLAASKPPPITIRLLVTNYRPWLRNPTRERSDRQILRALGVGVTADAEKCTHLCAERIARTKKFVLVLAGIRGMKERMGKGDGGGKCGRGRGREEPYVLSSAFIADCVAREKLLDRGAYALVDREGEEQFLKGETLEAVLRRAAQKEHGLLHERTVYCAEGVRGGVETYREIVKAAGGSWGGIPGEGGAVEDGVVEKGEGKGKVSYLLVGVGGTASGAREEFERVMGRRGRLRVVETDWLLDLIMRQEEPA